ncbi:MAG: DUF3108 domain-containing protein [Gammaproteobacteria bacterium]|nr:DUF3108 domain-containing protein [Gammaproteobacteria bacterium]
MHHIVLLFSLLLTAIPAAAQDLTLPFSVKYKGLPIADLELSVMQGEDRYGVGIGVESGGLASVFGRQKAYFFTVGDRKRVQPNNHNRVTEILSRGIRESVVNWDENGQVADYNVNPKDPVHETDQLSNSRVKYATDPLTPLYRVISGQQGCDGQFEVFDGRRHYQLNISMLDSSDQTFTCKLSVNKFAGFDEGTDFDINNDKGASITFERTDIGNLPMELEINTPLGTVKAVRK